MKKIKVMCTEDFWVKSLGKDDKRDYKEGEVYECDLHEETLEYLIPNELRFAVAELEVLDNKNPKIINLNESFEFLGFCY